MNRFIRAMQEMGVVFPSDDKTAASKDIRWQAVFFMGPSGSGKSFVKTKRYMKYMNFRIVDADEMKKEHPDYDPMAPFKVHEWSKKQSEAYYNKIVEDGSGEPIVVDGTGRTPKKIYQKALLADENGYRTFLIYVFVPFEVSIFRNRNRDRFVEEKVIIDQHKQVAKTFGVLKSVVDKYKIIPNYSGGDVTLAKQDMQVYPVPQLVPPPRPGDTEYGMPDTGTGAGVRAAGVSRNIVGEMRNIARMLASK